MVTFRIIMTEENVNLIFYVLSAVFLILAVRAFFFNKRLKGSKLNKLYVITYVVGSLLCLLGTFKPYIMSYVAFVVAYMIISYLFKGSKGSI
jgi:uncharacterized membrane protein YwaF